jgi:glutamine amidotransferase
MNDLNYRSICQNTATKCVFAHIRAASATATTMVNNHPFVFGRHAIMHNGVISDFIRIRRQVCDVLDHDAFANIMGTTDSEHLAALYMTYLVGAYGKNLKPGESKAKWQEEYSAQDMDRALYQAFEKIMELQKSVLGDEMQPSSLNVAVTDGVKLVSYRFRNSRKEQPPSLYFSTSAGVTLNRKYPDNPDGPAGGENDEDFVVEIVSKSGAHEEEKLDPTQHGKHIIVSSEPTTYKENEWEVVPKNYKVVVEGDTDKDGQLEMESGEVKVQQINVKDEWYCEVLEDAKKRGYGTTG